MADNSPLILTIDFGTQSVRAGLFDELGDVVALEKEKYVPAYYSAKPNYAEQDPAYYFDCLCKATNRLVANNAVSLGRVKGITMTCFRDSAVIMDKENNVIRPMILWLDQRTAQCKNKLPMKARIIFGLIGKTDTIELNRRRTIANWLIENEPGNWAKTDKYIAVSTYFTFRLTGNMADSASDQVGHYPMDFKNRCWYKNPETNLTGQVFSIKGRMLATIVPEGSIIGSINDKASQETGLPVGLPMYACGADKSCDTLGLGIIDDSKCAISLGTSCTVETTITKYRNSEPYLPSYPSCIPGFYNMEVQIYRGYWMINWFLKEFSGQSVEDAVLSEISADEFNEKLSTIPAGSDGLVLQPYWGPGLRRPLAKGAIIGFSDVHTREHLYKAIIEGIDYALREGMEGFQKSIHHKFSEIRISGGGSQSDEICQITADIFGLPVSRTQTHETSSLGAAVAGFIAIGKYKDEKDATSKMVRVRDTFIPNADNRKKYDYLYSSAYEHMYPRLHRIYSNIRNFGHVSFLKIEKK